MNISIIIVNYNVKHFLDQCLESVIKASRELATEIIVVDNNSSDGSCSMVLEKYKSVNLIRNSSNTGFSKANNQGIKIAQGEYILILNPDTVLDERSLKTCFDFMESHPESGATGLKMIDGKGAYLPESKRSLPKPSTAFFKIFGLTRLFPSSRRINMYNLGHLDNSMVHEVDVLTGAFMFIRKQALNKTGYFDEDFFMYGEDIDLSYRIQLAGYKNYYLPEPPIIHYKGESTRKSNFNYVLNFYKSMLLFVEKHYSGRDEFNMVFLIKMAIVLRAGLSYFKRAAKRVMLPLIEGSLLYLVFTTTIKVWEKIRFDGSYIYPDHLTQLFIPVALIVTLGSLIIWGGYRVPAEKRRVLGGVITGSTLIILIYSFLPLHLRYSRAIILTWAIGFSIIVPLFRLLASYMGINLIKGHYTRSKRIVVVSGIEEYKKISEIVRANKFKNTIIGRITIDKEQELNSLGTIDQIDEVVRVNRVDEIILSSNGLSVSDIVMIIKKEGLSDIGKKIARTDSDFVLGSRSGKGKGEVYTFEVNGIK